MLNLQESTDDLEFARQGISKLFFLYNSQNCTTVKAVGEYCGYWCVHTHLLLILAAKRAQKSNMNYSEPKHVIHCVSCYGFPLLLHRGRQLYRRLSMQATFAFKPLKECGCMWPSDRISNPQRVSGAFKPALAIGSLGTGVNTSSEQGLTAHGDSCITETSSISYDL